MIQVAEFKYAVDFNEWMKANNDGIEIIEIKYVGNRHYGTAILLIYKKDSMEVSTWEDVSIFKN